MLKLLHNCTHMDGGAWCAAAHGVAKSQIRLSDFTFTFHALEKELATDSMFLPGESQGWGTLVGCHLWGHKELEIATETTANSLEYPLSHNID